MTTTRRNIEMPCSITRDSHEYLTALSTKTRVPRAVYIREAVDAYVAKLKRAERTDRRVRRASPPPSEPPPSEPPMSEPPMSEPPPVENDPLVPGSRRLLSDRY